jgi:hypothetical protein
MTWCRICKNIWQKAYRRGERKQRRVPPPVQDENGCLIWQGYIMPNGYGNSGSTYAHRIAYEQACGPIPEGMTVDHLCEVKVCVNPAHLELVTRGDNTRRYYQRRRRDSARSA